MLLQRGVHAVAEVLVFHKHGVGLEKHGGILTGLLPGLVREGVKLLHGLFFRFLQTPLLLLQIAGHSVGHRRRRALEEVDRSLDDTFGNAFSLNQNHGDFLLQYFLVFSVQITEKHD